QIRTLEQVRLFLDGTLGVEFKPLDDAAARYRHIGAVLQRFGYAALGRRDRGWVLRYLRATGGYSRSQLTRLVHLALAGLSLVRRRRAPRCPFPRRYTEADILLLVEVDRQFDTLSGPATAHLLRRAWTVYADARFERLAQLSVAHLYNLRASFRYTAQRLVHTRTRPTAVAIGTRRAPAPEGRPGFIRVDSVHQGDLDGVKGVYYINAVDCVTQWQVVACCERISEAYLLPVLEQLLAQFPFVILGFHADNGSEYINARVARLLEKLRIELTKSRPRHCNDNALAETKNGAVVRKTFGYGHIAQRHAAPINAFCREHLNPLLNLHRPCLFATEIADPAKPGRTRKVYRPQNAMTPLEKLASLPAAESFLRPDHSLTELQAHARAQTDLLAATAFNRARLALFQRIQRAA
ncbi:MAG: DDE-type integrase/transposase/recombinase, partial [Betaproteobacteria bacterium]